MTKLLMPFLIWVFISHFILNTAFLIFTIFVFVSPSSRLDLIELALHYQYIGKGKSIEKAILTNLESIFSLGFIFVVTGVVYYILGAISFVVVFRLFRSMKRDEANKVVNNLSL